MPTLQIPEKLSGFPGLLRKIDWILTRSTVGMYHWTHLQYSLDSTGVKNELYNGTEEGRRILKKGELDFIAGGVTFHIDDKYSTSQPGAINGPNSQFRSGNSRNIFTINFEDGVDSNFTDTVLTVTAQYG